MLIEFLDAANFRNGWCFVNAIWKVLTSNSSHSRKGEARPLFASGSCGLDARRVRAYFRQPHNILERRKPVKYCATLTLLVTTAMMCGAKSDSSPQKRITEAAEVLHEIMSSKDRSIPEDLLEKAQCVGIVPNLKRAGFIVGAKYGKGVV